MCWIFQSTLPRGERQYFHFCSKMLKKISIHAPTRGATTFPGTFRSTYNYFNPRSHEGSDMIAPYDWQLLQVFQSTLPRGERHGSSQFSGMPVVISIHAPTRGATHGSANQYKSNLIFQSTLPRGERRLDTKAMKCNNKISIHAPTRGATAVENPVGIISGISIHAPTRGATILL